MKAKSRLSIDFFTRVQDDTEKRKYLILAELKRISSEFQYFKIYPHLSDLVQTYNTLREIVDRLADLRNKFPKRIRKIDWVNQTIEHEVVFVAGTDLTAVERLIEWALPNIKSVIDEGVSIYEYVDEDLSVEHVGIVPNYLDEGYFFLPDNAKRRLNLFRFEVSIFKSSEDKYRALKTRFLKDLEQGGAQLSPGSIKLDLLRDEKELPNPATFVFDTCLDFSFDQTIFPVAKRKLMQTLYREK